MLLWAVGFCTKFPLLCELTMSENHRFLLIPTHSMFQGGTENLVLAQINYCSRKKEKREQSVNASHEFQTTYIHNTL